MATIKEKPKRKRTYTLGMNVSVFVCTKLNFKRKKRRGKKVKISKLPVLERVTYIFKTGKLLDNTHYREVDPYWGIMWRQYEYLRYMELYVRRVLLDAMDKGVIDVNTEEGQKLIDDYMKVLRRIRQRYMKLNHWMFNAFHIQIGGVLSARFFGWKDEFGFKFIATFYEIAAESIKKLRFDIDKTRCSVYFYQSFWLSGLRLIKEIREGFKREKTITPNFNRGSKVFSLDDYEDFDNIDWVSYYVEQHMQIEEETNGTFIDTDEKWFESLTEEEIPIHKQDKSDIDIFDAGVNENEVSIDNVDEEELTTPNELDETELSEQELKIRAMEIVKKLIMNSGIPANMLYEFIDNERKENKIVKLFATYIKRAMREGKVKLTKEEIQILSKYMGKPISVPKNAIIE